MGGILFSTKTIYFMEQERTCTECAITKPIDQFYYYKKRDYIDPKCKQCIRERKNKRYNTMPCDKKAALLEQSRKTGKAYRDERGGAQKKKEWQERNKEKVRAYKAKHRASEGYKKKQKDPRVRLSSNVSRSIRYALSKTGATKGASRAFQHLPYTIKQLKEHLEGLFQEGMSWDNYGEWHIDHIIPQSALPYEDLDDENFQKCWALENLQPLWASENISKSSVHEGIRHRW